jgi:hypothetical protein
VSPQTRYLKIVSMALSLPLIALLALGPFLHAHYGNSQLTGFHVDGISQAVLQTDSHFSTSLPVAISSSDEESAALGVTTSHTRQTPETTEASPDHGTAAAACLAFVWAVFAAWRGHCALVRRRWSGVQKRHLCFAPGLTPLAHAPPVLFV